MANTALFERVSTSQKETRFRASADLCIGKEVTIQFTTPHNGIEMSLTGEVILYEDELPQKETDIILIIRTQTDQMATINSLGEVIQVSGEEAPDGIIKGKSK